MALIGTMQPSPARACPDALNQAAELGLECRRRSEDDCYGVRLRVPGGELGAEQAREVAAIARTSSATIEVTRRGLLGLDGLPPGEIAGVAARLDAVGLLSRDTGRLDVVTHPWAGLDAEESTDPRALAWRLSAAVRVDLPACELMIDGRSSPAPACWSHGLALVAGRGPNGDLAYRVLVGGARGPRPRSARVLPAWVAEGQVTDVVRQILAMAARFEGGGSRLVRLLGQHGAGPLLDRLEERIGTALPRDDAPIVARPRDDDDPGWFAQRQEGLWAIALDVLPGALTADRLDALAVLSEQMGDGSLRVLPGRRLALTHIRAGDRPALVDRLDALGLAPGPTANAT